MRGPVFPTGRFYQRAIALDFNGPRFTCLLPPGDHLISVRATDTYNVGRYVRVEPGRRDLRLLLDLPPQATLRLVGGPAPELRGIKGWKNGGPLTPADLRGKVVLLDFWGTWCGPCLSAMPALMKLHDDFHDQGLVIVAVHDDSVESIEAMDRELAKVQGNYWTDRDLPFLIALDGGGPTRVRRTGMTCRGQTTAAYGITSFPTSLLIDRDGTLIGPVKAHTDEGRAEIAKRLNAAPAR